MPGAFRCGLYVATLLSSAAGHTGFGLRNINQHVAAQSNATSGWSLPLTSGVELEFPEQIENDKDSSYAMMAEQQGDFVESLHPELDQGQEGAPSNVECRGNCLTFHVPYSLESLPSICNKAEWEFAACAGLDPKPEVNARSPIQYCSPADHTYKTHYHYFVHSMLLSEVLQLHTGVQMVQTDDPFDADIVVCDEDGLQQFKADPRRTGKVQYLIGLDHKDAASVNVTAAELGDANLLTFAKQYAHRDPAAFCDCSSSTSCLEEEKSLGVARHLLFLRHLMRRPNQEPLSDVSLASISKILESDGCGSSSAEPLRKISAIIPFWLTVRRGANFPPLYALPLSSSRRIHVAFVGSMHQDVPPGDVYFHRHGLANELRRIGQRRSWNVLVYEGRMESARFQQVLRDSILFVSPFGLGEWSGKDEEAVLNGAILVKPGASWLKAAVPIYTPGETCLEVRPDWADLEEVLTAALHDAGKLMAIQRTAYQQASRFVGYYNAVQDPELVEAWGEVVEGTSKGIQGL